MVKNDEIKLLEVDGIAPTVDMIRSEAYPITNEFYIVTTQNSNPQVQKIIDWVTSSEGQQLLEQAGYVPINATKGTITLNHRIDISIIDTIYFFSGWKRNYFFKEIHIKRHHFA